MKKSSLVAAKENTVCFPELCGNSIELDTKRNKTKYKRGWVDCF